MYSYILLASPLSAQNHDAEHSPSQGGQNGGSAAGGKTRRAIFQLDPMTPRIHERNHALSEIAAVNWHGFAVELGGPAGHPGIGDDQKARSRRRDLDQRPVGVKREPVSGGKGLPRDARNDGQGIFRHQHGGARVAGSKQGENRGRIVVPDLGGAEPHKREAWRLGSAG